MKRLFFRLAKVFLELAGCNKIVDGEGCVLVSSSFEQNRVHKVTLCYEETEIDYLVSFENVQTFIVASANLYCNPGFNPHNHRKTTPIREILVYRLQEEGPFWWSTPNLRENSSPGGAVLLRWSLLKRIRPLEVTPDKHWTSLEDQDPVPA